MAILVISIVRKWRPSWILRLVIGRSLQKPSQWIPWTNEPKCRAHNNVCDTYLQGYHHFNDIGRVVAAILYVTSNVMVKSHQVDSSRSRADTFGHTCRTNNYVSTTNTWGVIVILMIFGCGGGHIGFKKCQFMKLCTPSEKYYLRHI